jgi:hypothetical protein
MMSLNVFLAFCILGINFMLYAFYAFFQWTYGDKRSTLTRQIAAARTCSIDRLLLEVRSLSTSQANFAIIGMK